MIADNWQEISLLVPVAKLLLALPCSNMDVERFFTLAKRLDDYLRRSINEETVERNALHCLDLRVGIIEVLGMWQSMPEPANEGNKMPDAEYL